MAAEFCVVNSEPIIAPPEQKTLPEYILPKAKEHAENGKMYYAVDAISGEKRSFHDFDEESKKIASALFKMGLRKNDHVIYMPSEMIKLHIFLMGVWRANGVCRASYPDDDIATLQFRINESNSHFILCDVSRLDVCKETVKLIEWHVNIITTEDCDEYRSIGDILRNEDGKSCPNLEVNGDDPALILCTSGTTGAPKGAVLNHYTLVQHVHLFSLFPFTNDKPNLMFSIASHYTGSVFTFCLIVRGRIAILTGKITKEILWNTIDKFKPGIAFAFPTYLLTLVSPESKGFDFSSIEYFLTGGGMVTPAIKTALMRLPNVKDVINGYGLSEAGVCITNCVLQPADPKHPTYPGLPDFAIGKPYPGVIVQIRDIDTLKPLGPKEKGELWLKYSGLFHSYYKNPEATAKAFVDGFLRSGDIGYYDEQGFIYVVDRLKEIFKYYNNHISPSDLENVIGQHPLVDEVCVIGIPDLGGHVPRAFITLKGDTSKKSESELTKEIMDYAHAQLPNYKHLRGGIKILPELPKGKSGKITRALVAKYGDE